MHTEKTGLKPITIVYVYETDEILHLYTSCGDIDTTTNHPFYVIDKGWVAAGDLIVGDEVYLIDGTTAIITGSEIEKLDETILVYNLEVADFNTYFVGDEAVLVHNYKRDIKQIKDAAKKAGIPKDLWHEFGDYIEDLKSMEGKRNDANFSFSDLVKYAKEFLEFIGYDE